MPKRNPDAGNQLDAERPTSLIELGRRISAVVKRYQSVKLAAESAGKSPDQIAAYRKGENEPSFLVMARLADRASVSLDWLATGEGEMLLDLTAHQRMATTKRVMDLERELAALRSQTRTWDRDLLRTCGVAVVELLEELGKELSPEALLDLILAVYDLQIAQREEGRESLNVAEIVRLVRRAA